MLRIRKAQMNAFSEYCVEQFTNRMFTHIVEVFPQDFDRLGEDAVHEIIRAGIDRATKHGFHSEYDVARYIDLMVAFGKGFDHNPSLPRFAEIIQSNSYDNPSIKMDDLIEVGTEYAEEEIT